MTLNILRILSILFPLGAMMLVFYQRRHAKQTIARLQDQREWFEKIAREQLERSQREKVGAAIQDIEDERLRNVAKLQLMQETQAIMEADERRSTIVNGVWRWPPMTRTAPADGPALNLKSKRSIEL